METWSFVNNNTITVLVQVQSRIYRRVESGPAGWEDCNYNYLLPSGLALLNVISALRSNNFDLIVLYHNIITTYLVKKSPVSSSKTARLYKPT